MVLLLASSHIMSQGITHGYGFDQEIYLHVDNDAMLFHPRFDKYYSSGVYFGHRRLRQAKLRREKPEAGRRSHKSIIEIRVFHQMFTPQKIYLEEVDDIDRPYAGWFGLSLAKDTHFDHEGLLTWYADAGWLGPATGTEYIQKWLHRIFNRREPQGWEYQISNTLAAHVAVAYTRRIFYAAKTDLSGFASMKGGTILNSSSGGVLLRYGRFNRMRNSAVFGSRLNADAPSSTSGTPDREFFIYSRFTYQLVLYNATIEGNLLGDASPLTRELDNHVFQGEMGLVHSLPKFDLSASIVYRSKEVTIGGQHQYVSLKVAYRI